MKRSQVVFVTVVFTALVTGILVERSHRLDPTEALDLAKPRHIEFEPLDTAVGDDALTGIVTAADGSPAEDVLVHLRRAGEPAPLDEAEPLHWTHTGTDGRFALTELPAGPYVATLLRIDVENSEREVRVPHAGDVRWSLPEPLGTIPMLAPIRRSDLRGRLVAPPTGDAAEPAEASWEGFEVAAVPAADTPPASGAFERRASVAADGAFVLPQLVEASYRLRVVPPWARGGSWPVLADTAHEHGGSAPAPEVAVRSAVLTGRVRDQGRRPVEGALVQVRRADAESRLWPPTSTDVDGRFTVRDLPAGRYRVRVLAGAGLFDETIELAQGERRELQIDDLTTRAER